MNPIEIEIEFKKSFGMTIAQAYKNLDIFKINNEKNYQQALLDATNKKDIT